MLLKKISDKMASACRWLWQAYLLVMLIALVLASVIVTVTGIAWCVIRLLTYLP